MIDVEKLLQNLKRHQPAASEQHLLAGLKLQLRHDPVLVEAIIADWLKTQFDFEHEDTIDRERRLLPQDD
jgi:hypothetical protein